MFLNEQFDLLHTVITGKGRNKKKNREPALFFFFSFFFLSKQLVLQSPKLHMLSHYITAPKIFATKLVPQKSKMED